jgi:hypothetical protein
MTSSKIVPHLLICLVIPQLFHRICNIIVKCYLDYSTWVVVSRSTKYVNDLSPGTYCFNHVPTKWAWCELNTTELFIYTDHQSVCERKGEKTTKKNLQHTHTHTFIYIYMYSQYIHK